MLKGFIYKYNHSPQMLYSSEINYLKSRIHSHYIYNVSRVSIHCKTNNINQEFKIKLLVAKFS